MEVRLDVAEGQTIPPDTFVSLRIGSTRLQSRLTRSRTYEFPAGAAQQAAWNRLELYTHLGGIDTEVIGKSAAANADGRIVSPFELEIPCEHPRCVNSTLSVQVSTTFTEKQPKPIAEKRRRAQADMDEYMAKHTVVSDLANAMQELLRQKPEDPHKFLADLVLKAPSEKRAKDEAKEAGFAPYYRTHFRKCLLADSLYAKFSSKGVAPGLVAATKRLSSLEAELEEALRGRAEAEKQLTAVRQRSTVQAALLQIRRSTDARHANENSEKLQAMEEEIKTIRERHVARVLQTQMRATLLQKRLADLQQQKEEEIKAQSPKEMAAPKNTMASVASSGSAVTPPHVGAGRSDEELKLIQRQKQMLLVEIEELARERDEVQAALSHTKKLGGSTADLDWVMAEVEAALTAARQEYTSLDALDA